MYFASNNQTLLVTDNLAKYYAMNLTNGNLLWSKNNSAPFNSQVKVFKDKFFAIDFENILRCFSIKDGKEIWNFKTEKSFIKSQQKLSFIINDNKLNFINTLGDLSSVNINTGDLVWQTPTQSTAIYENYFSLKNSDLITENKSIYFSNNKNEFFSIDARTGIVNWKQTVNSSLIPTIIENLVFSVSNEGYLFVIDGKKGNIIRIIDMLKNIKNKKNKINPSGFIIARNKIYLSLNNGRVIKTDVTTGIEENIYKLSGSKLLRPKIFGENMYLLKNNAIIKTH